MRRFRTGLVIAEHLVIRRGVNVVQVRNDLTAALVALRIRQKYGLPFVFQLSFPILEAPFWEPDLGRRLQYVARAPKRSFLRWVLRNADLVLAISDEMKRTLVAEGLAAEKVVSFPLGVDPALRSEDYDPREVRAQLRLGDAPVILYFGALDRLRHLEFALEMMRRVLSTIPDARLLLVGSAERPEDAQWLQAEATRGGLDGAVHFVGRVPRTRVPAYLASAVCSIAPIPPIPLYTLSSPTKVLESLGVGTPVVANREIPDQLNLIEQSGGGYAVPYNVDSFAAAVVSLLQHRSLAREMGHRGRAYVLRERSYTKLATDVEGYYERTLSRTRPERP
jgi:glycosyltransferase involved in cell wall biosynthesis